MRCIWPTIRITFCCADGFTGHVDARSDYFVPGTAPKSVLKVETKETAKAAASLLTNTYCPNLPILAETQALRHLATLSAAGPPLQAVLREEADSLAELLDTEITARERKKWPAPVRRLERLAKTAAAPKGGSGDAKTDWAQKVAKEINGTAAKARGSAPLLQTVRLCFTSADDAAYADVPAAWIGKHRSRRVRVSSISDAEAVLAILSERARAPVSALAWARAAQVCVLEGLLTPDTMYENLREDAQDLAVAAGMDLPFSDGDTVLLSLSQLVCHLEELPLGAQAWMAGPEAQLHGK